jgi:DNA-binding NarL/FixJ family response regulator
VGGVRWTGLRTSRTATTLVCNDVRVETLSFNVLILDGHVLLAQTLAVCLRELDGVRDVVVAGTTEEAAAYVTTTAPEVVLVYYRLDGSLETEFIKDMKQLGSNSEFVVLTASDSVKVRHEARLSGAIGVIHKSASLHDLTQEVVRVGATLVHVSRELAEEAVMDGARSTLTSRELEVPQRVLARLSNKTIARTLFLSPNTVRNHLANVRRKLEAKSKLELAVISSLASLENTTLK